MCKKLILLMFVTVSVLGGGMNKPVFADMIGGISLNAHSIVDAFNGLNGGTGFNFYPNNPANNAGIRFLSDFSMGNGATQSPDTSAYYYSHNNPFPDNESFSNTDSFLTLDVGFNLSAGWGAHYGMLNYHDGTTSTSQGNTLKVGAAYLYMLLATTDDIDRYGTDGSEFAAAIRLLIGQPFFYNETFTDWDNPYLQMLLAINDNQDYWQSDYNPDAYYDEIGNYSIFVMNAETPRILMALLSSDMELSSLDARPGYAYKDYLYIAPAANPYEPTTTPEPGTLLLFGLGMTGLPFARRLWKKSGKK